MSTLRTVSSARPVLATAAAAILVSFAGAVAPAAAATDTRAQAAKPRYVKLKSVGLEVRSASLKSRTLRAKVTANQRLSLRFAIVRGTKQLGSAKISVPKGTTSLKLLLNQKSRGTNLRLRVTARTGRTKGRQRIGVQLLKLPVVTPKPKPTPTPTPTVPTTGQGTPPAPANQAPTALALTNASVDENRPANATVGNLAGTDPDPADTLGYAFAAGAGDADNASFVLESGTLRTAAPFDRETKASYAVRLAVSDGRGGVFSQAFTVTVNDVNEIPTDLALSSTSIAENAGANALVGSLSTVDPDAGDTATYSLVSGAGDADNAAFVVSGSALRAVAGFDVEAKSSYAVRLRTTDSGGLTREEPFTITVTDVNEVPTDLDLSSTTVAENAGANALVGSLSSVDPDAADTHTYSLVSGTGDTDNASFTVSGSALRTTADLDFEAKSSYSVRLRTTDSGGLTREEPFTITVTDANDAPTDIASTGTSVAENQPSGTAVGTLSGTDQDAADTLTFALVSGTGDTDNASFAVNGTTLETAASFDFETKSSYAIRLRVSDAGGGTFEKQFTITVTDANDAPTDIASTGTSVAENQPSGTAVGTLSGTDQDAGDSLTFALVSGTGDTDNASFAVNGTTLETAASFDFETTSSYAIRLRVSDGSGGTFDEQFTITVTNANDAPTDIGLSNSSVAENQPANTLVGSLSTTDQDTADSHTYSLVAGTGDTDNAAFAISGSALRTAAVFDVETKSSYAIRIRTSDGNGGTFDEQVTITVTDVNDAPVLTGTGTPLAYTENAPAVAVDGAYAVTDQDDANLEGAVVAITLGHQVQDTLAFTDQNGITGTYDTADGVLTLTGTATLAQYQAALRSITYSHAGDDPLTTKTISATVDDGDVDSATVTRDVTITAVNDAPALTTTAAALAYPELSGAVAVDPGVTVGDPDSAQIGGATVAISGNYNAAQDVLAYTDMLGITGTYDAGTGVLSLTGTTTAANYQAALRSVTYANSSSNPSPLTRTVTFTATDAEGATSAGATRGITITAANDSATVTTTGGALAYTENGAATPVDSGLEVADVDDANLEGARIEITAGLDSGDLLGFTNQNGITGTYAAGVLTLSGTASLSTYRTALRSITFSSTDDAPTTTKTVSFRADDGDGLGPAGTRTIAVTPVNDAPTVTTTIAALAYTENAGPVAIDGGLTVTDPDSATLTGATVEITAGYLAAQDVLSVPMGSGLTTSVVGSTVTLSGAASVATYQAALRTIRYENTSDSPSTVARTVTFTVSDGTDPGSATRGIAVTPVNDPPTAVDDSGTTDEDTPLVVAAPGVLANDTDPDVGDTKTVVSSTAPAKGTVVINGNGSYTFQPGSAFQGLSTGESEQVTFTYTMQDSAGAQDTATVTITVTGVSDAPTPVTDSYDAIGNTGLFVGTAKGSAPGKQITGSVLTNDTDPDTPTANLVTTAQTKATTGGGTVTIGTDGTFVLHPDDGDTTDSFTYTVSDGVASATGTVNIALAGEVWYVKNDTAAGGDGTSDTPFDTLAEAETASGTGDTTYVYDGDDTTTGLDTGYVMNASERLIGESQALSVDPDGAGGAPSVDLRTAQTGAQPRLTASGEDVIVLAASVLVDGVDVDPSGAGGGVSGGAGTSNVRVEDVDIVDTGTAGTQPGLELDGTTGTNRFADLTVVGGGSATAIGVRVNNAGTVVFEDTGTISVTTAGAKALDIAGTALDASKIDTITVTGSGTGAVRLSNASGTKTLGATSMSLQTTSGATPALEILDSGATKLEAASAISVSATGGPAVDIRNSSSAAEYVLDSVTSTNSAGDGINLDGNSGAPVSIGAGSITGATTIGVDVNGGNGSVTYAGTIGDGPGASVDVTGRTGGTVTFSGAITDGSDAGGGITVAGNTGGTTTFSGGLTVSTGTGDGLAASGGGTLVVTGSANAIASTTGRALSVANTTIGASGLTFLSVSSNGAPNGIVLDSTGSSGSLTITGSGTAGSGGTIQNVVGGDDSSVTPAGTGVVLQDTQSPSLSRMTISNASNYGIRGDDVRGLTIANTTISGTNGTNDAAPFRDASIRLTNLSGSAQVTNSQISGGYADNLAVENSTGSLDRFTMSGTTIGANSTTGGNDGVRLESLSGAAQLKATFTGNSFTSSRGDLLQYSHNGNGAGDLVLQSNAFSNNHPAIATGGGGVSLFQGGAAGGDTTMTIDDNTFRDAKTHAVLIVNSTGPTNQTGTFTNNRIGVSGVANSGSLEGNGLQIQNVDTGTTTWTVTNNQIRQYNASGLFVQAGGGASATGGTVNTTVTGNTIEQPGNNAALSLARRGMEYNIGTTPGDTFQACAAITGNSVAAGGTDDAGAGDIRLRQRQATTFRLPGYAGAAGDEAAVRSFVAGNNTGATVSTSYSAAGGGFTGGGATCP